jgi:hypothetical protein
MNANLTAVIATERQQRYTAEATEYRRSRTARAAKVQRPTRRRSHRVSTFFKDLATASL